MVWHPSWSDIEAAVYSGPPSPSDPSSSSCGVQRSTWRTNDRDVTDFGQERLDDRIRMYKCEQCSKPVLARYKDYHRQNCDLARAIQQGRASPSILEPDPRKRKRRLSELSDGPSRSNEPGENGAAANPSPQKKLTKKAAKALEVEERRRQRLEKKARKEREAAENKGRRRKDQPLDVNKQCGVINDNGTPCMRSLTCKTHAMGAKRSVPGRSKPYDELLLEWQKANNPAFLAKLEKREEERARVLAQRKAKKLAMEQKIKAREAAAAAGAAAGGKDGAGGKKGDRARRGGDRDAGKDGAGQGGRLGGQRGGNPAARSRAHEDGLFGQGYADNDLYAASAEDQAVEDELQSLLGALRARASDERVAVTPLARRSFHGLHTSQVRRFLTLRQAFSSSSGRSSLAGASRATPASGGSSVDSSLGFRPPPVVAGGGWGPGMFASHS